MSIWAVLCTVLKNVIYGASVIFVGELSATVDVLDLLSLRFLMSALVLWLLKITRVAHIEVGLKDVFTKTERHPFVGALLLAALFEPVLYMLFETLGVSMTTGVMAGVLLSLTPVTACIAEMIVLRERSSFAKKFFLGLGILGVVYIALHSHSSEGKNTVAGILFMLLAVVTGELFAAFSRRSSKHFRPLEIVYASALLGAVVFNAINVIRHLIMGTVETYFAPLASTANLMGFFYLAVISTICATAMNNYALGRMQLSTVSAFGGLSTLTTVLLGVFWGGEVLHGYHAIGFSLILARMVGVSYLSIREQRHRDLL